jgi:hypothetical protein
MPSLLSKLRDPNNYRCQACGLVVERQLPSERCRCGSFSYLKEPMPHLLHWIEGWVALFAGNRIAYELVRFHEARVDGDSYWFNLGFSFP